MNNRAILIIDMLNDFVREGGALYIGDAVRKIIPVIAGVVADARSKKWPIFYICDQHRPDDLEFKMFPPHCIIGSEGAKVCDELKPSDQDLIIPKRRYSGFYGTELDLALREREIEEIILVGVCTNICVLYTAADACMRNYKVMVVRDGVASFDEAAHNFALTEMEKTLGVAII
ncbi:MAG: cysteine hydrolase family protein [Thermacetogeniaceae bacterium]